jgi:hypothetical protein
LLLLFHTTHNTHTHVDFKVFHNILHSPDINHELFKVGLATSIAIMLLKGYVELYAGKTQKRKVEYDNFKSATHWTIVLILISWISFHLSLSPVYGTFKTWLIMIGFGYGILLQSALLVSNNVNLRIFLVVFLYLRLTFFSLYSYADTSLGAKHNISCFDDSLSADVQIMQLRAAPQLSFRHRNRNQISEMRSECTFHA